MYNEIVCVTACIYFVCVTACIYILTTSLIKD